jgi:hypothetical protein
MISGTLFGGHFTAVADPDSIRILFKTLRIGGVGGTAYWDWYPATA